MRQMRYMKQLILGLLLILAIFTSGCTSVSSNLKDASEGNASSAVYINVNDKHYINAWELELSPSTELTEFAKVQQGAVIIEGTSVYTIPGYEDNTVVAVKGESIGLVTNMSGYLIYVLHEPKKSHYPYIKDKRVKQINIYSNRELIREIKEDDIASFLHLFEQEGPYNEFHYEDATQYTVLLVREGALSEQYGVMEKNGQFGLAHIESKLPDEIAPFFLKLSN